ncbi:MAG: glycosyltransferase family 4 protein [Acidimicrobiales bacterium]
MHTEPAGPSLVVLAPASHRGGAELVLKRLVLSAVGQGWQVRCLCPTGPLVEDLLAAGVTTVTIPHLGLPAGPRALAALRLGIRSLRVAVALFRARAGTDRILVNGLLGLPAVALARPRAPVVLLIHEVVRRPDRVRLIRRLGGVVARAITISDAAAEALAGAGLEARVVPNGTPWPIEPSPAPAPYPPVFGCVAALTPGKGQHVLLEALSRMDSPDVVVELVGEALPKDHGYVAALHSQADAAGLAHRVRFVGHLAAPLERVRRWTAAVTASTEPEGVGLSVLEAMSVGVPVVCADHGGTPEVLGGAGLLVPPGDATALAEALSRLITDNRLRSRCAEAGRARVAQRYALSDRVAELLQAVAEPLP